MEVDWVSEEDPDLTEPPLNLVLYRDSFENIHVYIEYSHCQFRVDGLDDSLRDFKEL